MKTDLRTPDNLAVYDLDPQAAELWAIAGPDGLIESEIDTDNLPTGCRWITDEEWEALQSQGDETMTATCKICGTVLQLASHNDGRGKHYGSKKTRLRDKGIRHLQSTHDVEGPFRRADDFDIDDYFTFTGS